MQHSTFPISPYKFELTVVFGKSAGDILQAINCHEDPSSFKDSPAFCVSSDVTNQIVVGIVPGPNLNHGALAHEAFHVVDHIFKVIGQSLTAGDEAAAYLIQHVVELCCAAAKKHKIRISNT